MKYNVSCIGKLQKKQQLPTRLCSSETFLYMGVSKNMGTLKSSILIGFSIINHPFWGTHIFGNTYILGLPPTQDASHHQDYEPFLVGNPNLNLHLPLASWVGGRSNLYIQKNWWVNNITSTVPPILKAPHGRLKLFTGHLASSFRKP